MKKIQKYCLLALLISASLMFGSIKLSETYTIRILSYPLEDLLILVTLLVWGVCIVVWVMDRMFIIPTKRYIKSLCYHPVMRRYPILIRNKDVTIKRSITFTESCLKNDLNDPIRNNILFGVSLSFLPKIRPQKYTYGRNITIWFKIFNYVVIKPNYWNSFTITWSVENGKIYITPVVYRNGERIEYLEILGEAKINESNDYKIKLDRRFRNVQLIKDDGVSSLMEVVYFRENIAQKVFRYIDICLSRPAMFNMYIEETKK